MADGGQGGTENGADGQETAERRFVAFTGSRCVAGGSLEEVATAAKLLLDEDPAASVLILDARSSRPFEVDFRGTCAEVLDRLPRPAASGTDGGEEAGRAPAAGRAPGRPRLGVVAREVTLLPRHWEWLNEQPGGASVTLRKLVEEARRSTAEETRIRNAREACYRFMNTVAGNEPGFEEALRALYAGDRRRFEQLTEDWPTDVRDHARQLAAETFA